MSTVARRAKAQRHALEQLGHTILEFIRLHQAWAAPIVFALAFAESLAFLSFFVPAWAVLVGIGAMMKTADIAFFPVLLAGALGAALGDWLSYWIGYTCKDRIARMRPFSTHPNLLVRGEAFIQKWGALAISSAASPAPCAPRCRSLQACSACRRKRFKSPTSLPR